MYKRFIYIILGLPIFFFSGCKEPYYPDIETQDNVLVVDALITTEDGPYVVSLSESVSFYTETYKANPIENATIYVEDNKGIQYYFYENRAGTYYSNKDAFKGQIGQTYILHIITGDGDEYVSESQTIPQKPTLVEVNSFKERMKAYDYNAYGNLYYTEKNFLNLTANLQMPGEKPGYFKSDWKATLLVKCAFLIDQPTGHDDIIVPVWAWHTFFQPSGEVNVSTSLNTRDNLLVDDKILTKSCEEDDYANMATLFDTLSHYLYNVIKHGEDSARFYPFEGDSLQQASLDGWLVNIKQYSMNSDAYQFWKEVKDQMEYTGEVFDPIQTQIESNIKCVSDTSKLALGFFEASSVIEHSVFIDFSDKNGIMDNQIFDTLYNLPRSYCTLSGQPSFWLK